MAHDPIAQTIAAAARDDVDALFTLSTWHLIGDPVPRDLPRARVLLRRAVEIGHVDAALMEIALTANGSGAPADWGRARTLLDQAAVNDPVAAGHRALICAMEIDANGTPLSLPTSEIISNPPTVHLFRNLYTPVECAHVAQAARELLEPTVVIDPKTGRNIPHPIRTSYGATLGPTREDLVIAALSRRLATISDTAVNQGEPLSILCYTPGQEYRPHFDYITGAANQRIKTIIVYLNDGYSGGETHFIANGVRVAARAGDAIMFDNVTPSGDLARDTQHAGLPVTSGTKWIATRWIRAAPFDVWNDR
jgi:prolyl 4-hydroxylase